MQRDLEPFRVFLNSNLLQFCMTSNDESESSSGSGVLGPRKANRLISLHATYVSKAGAEYRIACKYCSKQMMSREKLLSQHLAICPNYSGSEYGSELTRSTGRRCLHRC